MKSNPFRPDSPVNPGMFVGRLEEITALERALLQTKVDSPSHFMITGERGIGKTSLLLYMRFLAKGDIGHNGEKFNFLVIDLDVDSRTTQVGLAERIAYHLDRVLAKTEPARNFLKETWAFLQRITVKGTGIEARPDDEVSDEVLLDQFASSLCSVTARITKEERGGSIFSALYDGIKILECLKRNNAPPFDKAVIKVS